MGFRLAVDNKEIIHVPHSDIVSAMIQRVWTDNIDREQQKLEIFVLTKNGVFGDLRRWEKSKVENGVTVIVDNKIEYRLPANKLQAIQIFESYVAESSTKHVEICVGTRNV